MTREEALETFKDVPDHFLALNQRTAQATLVSMRGGGAADGDPNPLILKALEYVAEHGPLKQVGTTRGW